MARSIREWLAGLGLDRYAEVFEENDLDLDLVADLSDSDLKDLGVESMGHRKKILRAICDLTVQKPFLSAAVDAATEREAVFTEPQAERRQVTVMFCDLVGSTELSAALDPEDMREIIRSYQNAVAGEVSRFGGHVAKFMGDGVMVLFGYPQAHEDDSERAIRSAMAIIDSIARIQASDARQLQVRIGIATGRVVVGDLVGEGAAQEEAVVGDTPNLAARLQATAEPNTIAVATATRDLAGNAFVYVDLGARNLKGLREPVRVWRIDGERTSISRFEDHRRHWTKCIGRDNEVDRLFERWQRARDGSGQAVIISGEAGIGKSRILEALRERVASDDHTLLQFQCSPYHANSALHPIIIDLERSAGFAADDSVDQKIDKLDGMLSRTSSRTSHANLPLFCELLSLSGDRFPTPELTPQQKKSQILDAVNDRLADIAKSKPVLLYFEDVQWADPTTLDLLGMLIERLSDQRILALITHRPEFHPPWRQHDYLTSQSLTRLGRNQTVEIVNDLVHGKQLPAEVVEEIVVRTDGVPLFIEELTMTVLESGLVTEGEDQFELAGPLPRFAIPSTLQDSLMARLDRLPKIKAVAQIGAVIGREFAHDLIVAAAPQELAEIEEALDQLVSSELVLRRGKGTDAVYEFKHGLVRDTAYESLLKATRHRHHARIAQLLEERFPTVAENEPELVAHHYTEAANSLKAIGFWQKAAQRAMQRSANAEAEHHLTQGLELLKSLPETPERRRLEAELQNARGVCLMPTRGFGSPEVAEAFLSAASVSEAADDFRGLFVALRGLGQYQMISGDLRSAAAQTRRVMSLADDLQDHGALIEAHHLGWITLTFTGEFEAAQAHANSGFELYDRDRDHALTHTYSGHDPGVCCRSFRGMPLWQLGYPDKALESCRAGQQLAAELAHPFSEAVAVWATCMLRQLRRDGSATLEAAEDLITRSTEGGFALMLTTGEILRGWALAEDGALTEGIAALRSGMEQLRAGGSEFSLPSFFASLGDACRRNGAIDQGLSAVEEGLVIAQKNGDSFNLPELHRVKGELLLAKSAANATQAAASLQKALQIAARQRAKVLELRASVSLAKLRSSNEQRHKTAERLAQVYNSFTEGFDTPDLLDAKSVLDAVV
ncbi:MAG: adenylate/guanylate cyclase domain-containing protein [Alphaproteobacteria bacterium]